METKRQDVQPQLLQTAAVSAPRRLMDRKYVVEYLFILPALVGFILFYAYPAIRGLYISLTDWNLLTPPNFVGFDNYTTLLQDPEFWHSMWVTIFYVILNIPLQTVLALFIAVIFDRFISGMWFRSIMLLPWLIPNVVVGLLWLWMLDPSLGIVNSLLESVGLPAQPFAGSPDQAMPTIAAVNIWRHVGYSALLIFAGLQTVPKDVYEAGAIDGASEGRMFWSITLPLLRPVLVFVLITSLVGSFQIFDTIAIMTGGGPVNATRVIYWYIYEYAFSRFDFGYATAVSMVLFALLVFVSLVQLRLLRANESDLA